MDNSAIKKEASKILSEPDFQSYGEQAPLFDLWNWLRKFFELPKPHGRLYDPIPWQLLAVGLKVILVIAALGILFLSVRWLYYRLLSRAKSTNDSYTVTQAQRQEAQEQYASQAAEALQHQDYRKAVHCLFLAAVSQVIRDSLFQGAEFMTNREIANATDFSRFSDAVRLNHLFNNMVYFDEPLWFGKDPVNEQHYHNFYQWYEQFTGLIQRTGLRKRHA